MSYSSDQMVTAGLARGNEITFYFNGVVTERAFSGDGAAILWWIDGIIVSEASFTAQTLVYDNCIGQRRQFVVTWEEQPGGLYPTKARPR